MTKTPDAEPDTAEQLLREALGLLDHEFDWEASDALDARIRRFLGDEVPDERLQSDLLDPFELSEHAQERLRAPDAPRFQADPARVFPREWEDRVCQALDESERGRTRPWGEVRAELETGPDVAKKPFLCRIGWHKWRSPAVWILANPPPAQICRRCGLDAWDV